MNHLLSREIVGIMVSLERFLIDAEEKGNPFVLSLLEKQHFRLKLVFDRHIVSWWFQSMMVLIDAFSFFRMTNCKVLNEQNSQVKNGKVSLIL